MRFTATPFWRLAARLALLVACLGLAAPAAVAAGVTYGTPAWTNFGQELHQGPGRRYAVVGHVAGEVRVQVERCKRSWCQVNDRGNRGWMFLANLNFGQGPGLPLVTPSRDRFPAHGPGQVCFYTGSNFTGEAFCAESGSASGDLLLEGMDDRFASITVEGSVSVTVCRDFDFQSYCRRIVSSEPHLGRYLTRAISSYRVH